ncbi:alpha/beta hydrolase [Emticicia sp. BO119]|uniref:RBBP9/YdeN family alpha/beta hydrolase n=1 Tax=Emticicia sp. BO119 TaxID=2757768 RepID=UPI0015F00506|nr:alpha/beta hydrolase [Emticicia sp. BO119]MBA4849942.1 serine hydrolase family protein [Emticicia sp. BO119]
MKLSANINFLTIPGLASSGPKHWQTLWEKQYPYLFTRVEQDNWDLPVCRLWIEKLQHYIESLKKPTVLVAHSMGCITVAHWAKNYFSPLIIGAFLVAPADVEYSERLSFAEGFNPIPYTTLPFESVVVSSTNDIYATIKRSEYFAKGWGSTFLNVGDKGHINANSGIGEWEEGKIILNQFLEVLNNNSRL